MKQAINQAVSVICSYSQKHRQFAPRLLNWQNQDYQLGPTDYHHSYLDGRERQHIFELCDKEQSLWFRLRLDTESLGWTLEAVHDGQP